MTPRPCTSTSSVGRKPGKGERKLVSIEDTTLAPAERGVAFQAIRLDRLTPLLAKSRRICVPIPFGTEHRFHRYVDAEPRVQSRLVQTLLNSFPSSLLWSADLPASCLNLVNLIPLYCKTAESTSWASIDLLPNYGPGTSKRYRKPVTTGNTVISNWEKRIFRRSSDLAEAKIYLFAVLVIFDMPSTNHFFWSFCSQVGITMVLERFCGVFVFRLSALLYRDFDNVSDGLDLSKSG